MAKKLTTKQMVARYEALTEAAMHLELVDWTDIPSEREEGVVMADWLKREAQKWLNKSQEQK